MRTSFALLVAAAVVFCTASCTSPDTEPPDLFTEYTESNQVVNDPFSTGNNSGRDRMAIFAANGLTPEMVLQGLLSAKVCGGSRDFGTSLSLGTASACERGSVARSTFDESFGADADLYERGILVKHPDGELEWTSVLLAVEDKRTVIIDADGGIYEDLNDFRSHNDMFTTDDWILVAKDFATVDGVGTTTVPDHTPFDPVLLIGPAGIVVAGVVVVLLVVWLIRRSRRGVPPAQRETPRR